jgi:hypothetical protein
VSNATDEAFAQPRPGDIFHEMWSFWVVVVYVDDDHVVVMEGHPPCTLPRDGKLRGFETHDDYRKTYSYGTIPRYWVRLDKRDQDVTGWFDPRSAPE